MAYLMKDFECTVCDNVFEALVDKETTFEPCPECQAPAERIMSAPALATYNIMDAETRKEKLLKRSHEHSKKEFQKNHEKYEKYGYIGERRPWNLRSKKPKSE